MTGEKQTKADLVEKQLKEEIDNAWRGLLNHEAGRMIVWSILEMCHPFQSTFTGNSNSNFLEGERNIGLRILNEYVFPNENKRLLGDMMEEADSRFERLQRAIDESEKENEE